MMYVKSITKNKTLTINTSISEEFHSWWYFQTSFSRTGHHAGFRFYIGITYFSFEIEFTDNRHWDYKTGKFEEWVND